MQLESMHQYRGELTRELRLSNPKSALAFDQRLNSLPSGVNSGARWRALSLSFASASGSTLRDIDGNDYVDCLLGFGPIFLGHAHAKVNGEAQNALQSLDMPGGGSEYELLALDTLTQVIPCAEKLVFTVSGTEAVQAALRIARATTDRELIVRFAGHYHGWIDAPETTSTMIDGRGGGIDRDLIGRDESVVLPWNNLDAFETFMDEHGSDVAGVILEAIALNSGTFEATPGYLATVQSICKRHGALLIFDEVITGFRVSLGGAQERLGITPDLATFAKAMANGYPVAAVAGTDAAMKSLTEGKIFHAGTYSAWPAALAALHATVTTLQAERAYLYPQVEELAHMLAHGIRRLADTGGVPLQVNQIASVLQLSWGVSSPVQSYSHMLESSLPHVQALCEGAALHGAYIAPRGLMFLSAAHSTEDVTTILTALSHSLDRMRDRGIA